MSEENEAAGSGMGMGMGRLSRPGEDRGPVIDTGRQEKPAALQFDHERLQVYQAARECFVLVSGWLERKMSREVREQLDRSLTSVLSNIAEGAGKHARADKRRFYEIAKGSTTEAAAQLDIIRIRKVITGDEYEVARGLLLRVARMLHGLCGPPRP